MVLGASVPLFFFFKQKTAYEMRISDWSSDVCSSDLRASDRSFQVKWTETAYERGAQSGTQRWTAILTVVMRAPTDADTLRKNPLGVYVDAVDWSRELDPPAQSRPTPPPAAPPPVPAGLPLGSPLDPNLAAPTQPAPESRP